MNFRCRLYLFTSAAAAAAFATANRIKIRMKTNYRNKMCVWETRDTLILFSVCSFVCVSYLDVYEYFVCPKSYKRIMTSEFHWNAHAKRNVHMFLSAWNMESTIRFTCTFGRIHLQLDSCLHFYRTLYTTYEYSLVDYGTVAGTKRRPNHTHTQCNGI